MQENGTLGHHLIVDVWVNDPQVLDDPKRLEQILIEACNRGHLTVLGIQLHAFSPHGVTGVVLLAASHMSIHTWPEFHYAALDIFTCDGDPWQALDVLKEELDVERISVRELERGAVG